LFTEACWLLPDFDTSQGLLAQQHFFLLVNPTPKGFFLLLITPIPTARCPEKKKKQIRRWAKSERGHHHYWPGRTLKKERNGKWLHAQANRRYNSFSAAQAKALSPRVPQLDKTQFNRLFPAWSAMPSHRTPSATLVGSWTERSARLLHGKHTTPITQTRPQGYRVVVEPKVRGGMKRQLFSLTHRFLFLRRFSFL
jgi:hypothetical protein